METERGHMSLRRGVSWSPGGVRKPLQVGQESVDLVTESNASWDRRDYTKVKGQSDLASSTNQTARKANLTRSTSLSDQDLKEARVRSQIIAAQLTVPSNSNSRGVQLFNRRRQRVNAFTLKSGVEGGSGRGTAEDEKHIGPPRNNLTWAERASEGNDREQNLKNIASKPPWSPTRLTFRGHHSSDIMEEPSEPVDKVEDVKDTQERHFLPVNEKEEEEEVKMREEEEVKMREEEEEVKMTEEEEVKMREEEEEVKMKEEEVKMREEEKEVKMREEEVKEEQRIEAAVEQESEVKNVIPSATDHSDAVQSEPELGEAGVNGPITEPEPPGDLPNGCHDAPEKVSVSLSKQPSTIINRTARPFFSPTTVQSPDTQSPVMDIPPAPSYSTPPLPLPRPVAFSPPPPPPSYPTPPLPALTCQSPPVFSSPLCRSPAMSPLPPPVCQNAPPSAPPMSCYVSPTPPVTQYAPLTAPRPSTFVPKPATDWKQPMQIKTGILEETAARRANRKSMFTFKEKPVMAPNPELLSLVQGADERKKHGPRSVAEPASEEELLALGAEASNFLAKEEVKMEEATVPEWSTTLKSSRTRARIEHKPEQTLTNVTGKGAELFAKRQSRMEKYVLENQNAGQRRSPSPTMSLPPSWVYPSNMPGRVKAIASNSNISDQLSRTLKAQQPVQRKPVVKAPPPKPESPPLENGCTKIERDLSRHQPYQLNSSLFIFNPIKDPISSLPRGAPPPKPVVTSYSRQTSLPTSPSSQFSPQASFRPATCLSPQHPLSPVGGMAPGDQSHQYGGAPRARQPRITSPVSAFSPERVASPRSGAQAPRPTFSAKKAGIEPQAIKESPTTPTQTPTPTRTPQFTRRFSSPEGPRSGTWSPSLQTSQLPSNTPSRSPHTPISSSPVYPPWETRCQSPMVYQTSQPFSTPISRPQHPPTTTSPVSLVRENRCLSPNVSSLDSKANHRILAKNIINAAKRKNSPSPGTLSSHNLPISPLGGPHNQAYEHSKPPFSPFQSRALGAQSPPFTSPPPTPTQLIRSPVRLYNTRSLTDSDASVESEDSGLRSPGLRSYNTCPRGWGGSLRVKRSSISTDL